MNTGKTLFAQLMDFLPWSTFDRIVARYGGNRAVRTLSCAAQYQVMAFAQITYRESLRDIEACLSAQSAKLYHMGFREPVVQRALRGRQPRGGADRHGLCVGFDDHRSLPVGVPMGALPFDQGSGEDAHIA